MARDWQTLHLPLAAGLNQKRDPRALQAPELARCVDVQFDEIGGLQTRYPYAAYTSNILGGGTITDARRIVPNGSELLLFTKDTLYSYSAQLAKWVAKGTHLAVKVEEQPVFLTPGEQIECDRAELDGLVVYAWADDVKVFVAAVDKITGSVVVTPTDISGTDDLNRPRLVALDESILLFVNNITTANIDLLVIDPADPAGSVAASRTAIGSGSHNSYYDVVGIPGQDLAVLVQRLTPTTSYAFSTVLSDGTTATVTKARTCTGPIAVSVDPDGVYAQVVRANGVNIQGDLILVGDSSDAFTAQAIGTAPDGCYQIAAAHRSTLDASEFRCYVFWNDGIGAAVDSGAVKYNWVDTGNTLSAQGQFCSNVGLASRAFERDGRVFVNLVFASASVVTTPYADHRLDKAALQNTYFLYRDDAFLVAKMATNRAGGFPTQSRLPGVYVDPDDNSVYRWCGVERRIIPIGTSSKGYADRGPRDISLAFDSNEARRTARLGQTLYIAGGGEILQYDGSQLTEVGFHVYPYLFTLALAAAGSVADGTYAYKVTSRWTNARGEQDRSASSVIGAITMAGGPDKITITDIGPLNVTHKGNVATEVWRTLKDPTDDAPYYLVTSKDPSDLTGANCYIVNDTTDIIGQDLDDELADAAADDLETNPENGGILENLAPPAATIVIANADRLFLAGVAGDPDRVWYSKRRSDGEVAAFHDALVALVPSEGGVVTALAFLNETLVVFRETAIYMLPGDGYDNAGGGSNYGPARGLTVDVGAVNHESVAVTDRGLIFKSSKGWYLLSASWSLEYIGGPVSDYDDHTPLSIDVVETQHQIRILLQLPTVSLQYPASVEEPVDSAEANGDTTRMLVFDTLVGQWGEWTVGDGLHSCMYFGVHLYLTTTGPKNQLISYSGLDYGLDIETAWIKLSDLQGYGCVRWFEVIGAFISSHRLRVRVARDYWKDGAETYFDDKYWTPSPSTPGARLQVRHGPSIPKVQAIKIRLTAENITIDGDPPGDGALKLTGLGFELGFNRGLNRLLPAAQKQ